MSNGLKIDNTKSAGVAVTPLNTPEIKTNAEDTLKDTSKSPEANAQESNKPTIKKHLITYVGNGEYVDVCKRKWHNGDEETYSDEVYEMRKDIHFMVKYGAMKHSVVTV